MEQQEARKWEMVRWGARSQWVAYSGWARQKVFGHKQVQGPKKWIGPEGRCCSVCVTSCNIFQRVSSLGWAWVDREAASHAK